MIRDRRAYKFLVVANDKGDRTLIRTYLKEKFFNPLIVNATNLTQTPSLFNYAVSNFDIILLDLAVPGKAEVNIVSKLLRLAPACPIIILTSYSDIHLEIKSILTGVADYLIKSNLSSTTLYNSIIAALQKKGDLSDSRELEKRYSDLFYLSPQPMWVYDPDTSKIVQVNKAAIEKYGYSEKEFLNLTMSDIKSDQTNLEFTEIKECYSEPDGIYKGQYLHQKKSHDIFEVEIYSTTILINNKKFKSVISIDVSDKNIYERKLIKAIIKTQEDERLEVGTELHDNVCQILAVSQITIGLLKDYVPEAKMPVFNKCRESITLALEEIRNLSHRLAPSFFENLDLEESIRKLFSGYSLEDKCQVVLTLDSAVRKYPFNADIQLNLYRILQEQLRNIMKFANSSVIEVDMRITTNKLKMCISDNGIGFNTSSMKGGIGFANMRRRVELFYGNFQVTSSVGNGCQVFIDIPLNRIN